MYIMYIYIYLICKLDPLPSAPRRIETALWAAVV